jgi:hypothetical protein
MGVVGLNKLLAWTAFVLAGLGSIVGTVMGIFRLARDDQSPMAIVGVVLNSLAIAGTGLAIVVRLFANY